LRIIIALKNIGIEGFSTNSWLGSPRSSDGSWLLKEVGLDDRRRLP
jgi:hypothetical protein